MDSNRVCVCVYTQCVYVYIFLRRNEVGTEMCWEGTEDLEGAVGEVDMIKIQCIHVQEFQRRNKE